MKLVRFSNGKYGVRLYWWFGWHFLGLNDQCARTTGEYVIRYCMGTEEQARKAMEEYKLKYTIVDKQ